MRIIRNGALISLVRGDSGAINLGPIKVNGVEASNATGILSVKKKVSDTAYVLQIAMDSTNNIVFKPSDTQGLNPGNYVYDIQITIGTAVYTPIIGRFVITADVTRPVAEEDNDD